MPDGGQYLYLFELINYNVGMCRVGANGLESIGWPDLEAWSNMSGYDLQPFEAKLMIDISNAYVNKFRNSNFSKDAFPEFIDIEKARARTNAKVKSILR